MDGRDPRRIPRGLLRVRLVLSLDVGPAARLRPAARLLHRDLPGIGPGGGRGLRPRPRVGPVTAQRLSRGVSLCLQPLRLRHVPLPQLRRHILRPSRRPCRHRTDRAGPPALGRRPRRHHRHHRPGRAPADRVAVCFGVAGIRPVPPRVDVARQRTVAGALPRSLADRGPRCGPRARCRAVPADARNHGAFRPRGRPRLRHRGAGLDPALEPGARLPLPIVRNPARARRNAQRRGTAVSRNPHARARPAGPSGRAPPSGRALSRRARRRCLGAGHGLVQPWISPPPQVAAVRLLPTARAVRSGGNVRLELSRGVRIRAAAPARPCRRTGGWLARARLDVAGGPHRGGHPGRHDHAHRLCVLGRALWIRLHRPRDCRVRGSISHRRALLPNVRPALREARVSVQPGGSHASPPAGHGRCRRVADLGVSARRAPGRARANGPRRRTCGRPALGARPHRAHGPGPVARPPFAGGHRVRR